ncbi:MAG: LPXTG cell wall anchor domain-containing protein [Clostridia bacterium]|nr:LPXTG cell wall anchor domain-containing protein [Clostridia bacterium]
MKTLKKLEKILIMLAVIAVICGLATTCSAETSSIGDIVGDIPVLNDPTPTPTSTPTSTPSPIPQNNQTGNTTLPKTGANDTIMWVLLGACTIAAVYTYKKVRDYNV